MPESDKHRCLVKAMAVKFSNIAPDMRVHADIDRVHGFQPPYHIDGYIPDIYAYNTTSRRKYICEVKTVRDLETQRSGEQIHTFVDYINKGCDNIFLLAGDAQTATRAKTILRFMITGNGFHNCSVQVFDGLDYWVFDRDKNSWPLR